MIRIILVDDHAVVRNGYRRLLDAEPGLQVVGEAARADEADARVLRTAPDVALVDLSTKTVLNYLSLIRQKLDADNDFKLLHLAARHGLLDMNCTLGARTFAEAENEVAGAF